MDDPASNTRHKINFVMQMPDRSVLLMIIAAAITIIGLVTGWYFFIFLVFPFGLGVFNRKNKDD